MPETTRELWGQHTAPDISRDAITLVTEVCLLDSVLPYFSELNLSLPKNAFLLLFSLNYVFIPIGSRLQKSL